LHSGNKSGINDILRGDIDIYPLFIGDPMKKVTILGLYNTMATTILDPWIS